MSLKLKSGLGLSSSGGLGLGLGHGPAYAVTATAASLIGPVLMVAGGILIVAGLVGWVRRKSKEAEA